MSEPLLRMTGVTKRFPGVLALNNVDFEVAKGEIHGLLGENGAGKSTLLKILSGAHHPDSGVIEFNGRTVTLDNPHQAQSQGIVTIYQEFNLVPQLTIAENVFIGREPGNALLLNWRQMAEQTRQATAQIGINIDPMMRVRDLSVAEQQMVEIARALSMQSRLIIMDEPTSALSEKEVVRLMELMRELKSRGLSIIFVTHRLEEVMQVCDRITVLRDGQNAGAAEVQNIQIPDIIRMMVGRQVDDLFQGEHTRAVDAPIALEVRSLRRRVNANDPHAIVIHDISFSVRKGEIVGLAGLVGAGRTEIARVIFGADPLASGEILVDGKPITLKSPEDAIRHGIGLVPEDRKQQALFLALAVRENASIAALKRLSTRLGFVRRREEANMMDEYKRLLNIRMSTSEVKVSNLSGGNQQKVVLARWLALNPKVLIVDEPTRGIDVAAKSEVHALLHQMAASGIAVIMISSELPEIMNISDRIITIREGHLTGEIDRRQVQMSQQQLQEKLMEMMTLRTQNGHTPARSAG